MRETLEDHKAWAFHHVLGVIWLTNPENWMWTATTYYQMVYKLSGSRRSGRYRQVAWAGSSAFFNPMALLPLPQYILWSHGEFLMVTWRGRKNLSPVYRWVCVHSSSTYGWPWRTAIFLYFWAVLICELRGLLRHWRKPRGRKHWRQSAWLRIGALQVGWVWANVDLSFAAETEIRGGQRPMMWGTKDICCGSNFVCFILSFGKGTVWSQAVFPFSLTFKAGGFSRLLGRGSAWE